MTHYVLWGFQKEKQRRQQQPAPVLLPGKSHRWRSLVGCSPWGREELDMTEQLHFHFSLSCSGEGNGNPLQCSCLENPRDGGACWAAVYGVAQSQTRLKWLSSSSMGLHWDVYDLMTEQQQQKSRWLHLFPFLSLLNQTVPQNFLHTSWWLPLVTWQLPREQRLFVSFQVLVT